jgi:hypothetical protein
MDFQRWCVCIPIDGHRVGEKDPRSTTLSPRLGRWKVMNFINKSHIHIGIETQKGPKTNCAYILKRNSNRLRRTSMAHVKAHGNIWKETTECSESSNVDLPLLRTHAINHALGFLNQPEVDPILCLLNPRSPCWPSDFGKPEKRTLMNLQAYPQFHAWTATRLPWIPCSHGPLDSQ